jgi:hypothetical protein
MSEESGCGVMNMHTASSLRLPTHSLHETTRQVLNRVKHKTNEVANQMATSFISIKLIDYYPTNVS